MLRQLAIARHAKTHRYAATDLGKRFGIELQNLRIGAKARIQLGPHAELPVRGPEVPFVTYCGLDSLEGGTIPLSRMYTTRFP